MLRDPGARACGPLIFRSSETRFSAEMALLYRNACSRLGARCRKLADGTIFINKTSALSPRLVHPAATSLPLPVACMALPLGNHRRNSSSDSATSPAHSAKKEKERYLSFLGRNLRMLGGEMLTKIQSPNLDTMFDQNRVLWHFQGPESLDDFVVHTDVEIGGKSTAGLKVSRNNKMLFHGNLCTDVPRDGESQRSGYCALRSKQLFRSFNRKQCMDLSPFNVLRMRVRGDGRAYMVNLMIKGYFTDSQDDVWSYFMFTRGGPYWQDVTIPFTKFFMSSRGRVQDKQCPPDMESVNAIGLTMADAVDGEFMLEIDSISVSYDATYTEEYTYETYR